MAEKILHQDAVFISKATSQKALFEEVFEQLSHLGYVKGDYSQELIKHEAVAPTGIVTTPVARRLPNIAVPHLQKACFYRDLLVPIRCDGVLFGNMLTPSQQVPVGFVFLLLTTDAPARTALLARVVGLLKAVPPEQLRAFLNSKDPAFIYNFCCKHLPE